MRSKYTKPKRPCSRTCSAIKKGQDVFNKGSKWIVGCGGEQQLEFLA